MALSIRLAAEDELLLEADFSERYADGGAGLADVALIFAADRTGIYNVLNVDCKDFDRYRSPRGKRLRRLWVKD